MLRIFLKKYLGVHITQGLESGPLVEHSGFLRGFRCIPKVKGFGSCGWLAGWLAGIPWSWNVVLLLDGKLSSASGALLSSKMTEAYVVYYRLFPSCSFNESGLLSLHMN